LFNLVFEIAVKRSKIETRRTTFEKCNQIMVYAGDVLLHEKDYWMLKKYLHHWLNKKIRWD
jgi:hypothetical protein